MKIIRKIISTIFLLLTLSSLIAQDSIVNYRYNASPYNFGWKHEIPYIATAAGILATGFVIEKTNSVKPYTTEELNKLSRCDINSFDRGATYNWSTQYSNTTDILLIGSILAPTLFLTSKSTRKDFGWLMLMSMEVFSINYGIRTTVKNLSNRARPYVYNPEAPLDVRIGLKSKKSFFSGHVSTTATMSFFVATVISDYHPDMKTGHKIGLWSAAAIYPAITAYIRVASGDHFPTDVIAGYAVGAFTGWIVPFLHKKKKKEDRFSIAPININGSAGLYLSYKF